MVSICDYEKLAKAESLRLKFSMKNYLASIWYHMRKKSLESNEKRIRYTENGAKCLLCEIKYKFK